MGERPEFLDLSQGELRDIYTRQFATASASRIRDVYGADGEVELCDDAFWCYWFRAVDGSVPPDALSEVVRAVDVHLTATPVLGRWLEKNWLTPSQGEVLYEQFGARADHLGKVVRSRHVMNGLAALSESLDIEGRVRELWCAILRDRMPWAMVEFAREVPAEYLPLLDVERQDGLPRRTRHGLREAVRRRLSGPEPTSS